MKGDKWEALKDALREAFDEAGKSNPKNTCTICNFSTEVVFDFLFAKPNIIDVMHWFTKGSTRILKKRSDMVLFFYRMQESSEEFYFYDRWDGCLPSKWCCKFKAV